MAQSALVVTVPEAEAHVAHLRARHDPVTALGMPAHVTLLFPFVAPDAIDAAVLDRVRAAVAGVAPFAFVLREVRRFPRTLYLAPEPAGPFVTLTEALLRMFPEHAPYGGAHRTIVPHLTVADAVDPGMLPAVEAELRASLPRDGAIATRCSEVVLMESSSGRWRPMHAIALTGGVA